MKLNKKNIIFFGVLGLLCISIIYRLMNPYVQPRVDTLTYTGKINDSKGIQIKPSEDLTVVSRFLKKTIISGKVYKDLFALYKPFQKVKKEDKPILEEKDIASQRIQPVDTIEKATALEIKEYIASYRFYGSYKSEGQKAVFLAKNKLVLVARTGDRIDGKYLIDDIQDDFIRIKALKLNETIDIHIREFNDD